MQKVLVTCLVLSIGAVVYLFTENRNEKDRHLQEISTIYARVNTQLETLNICESAEDCVVVRWRILVNKSKADTANALSEVYPPDDPNMDYERMVVRKATCENHKCVPAHEH